MTRRCPEYRLRVRDDIAAQVAFWTDGARARGFIGGLGSGKTFAGAVEVLRQPPGSTGMVVSPTYPMLRDTTLRTFFEICPPALIREHVKSERRTELINGSTIFWRSADKPDSLRGPNLGWAWGDEWAFVDELAHKITLGRLRRSPGRFWITTTPNGQNWLYMWAVKRGRCSIHHASTADNPFNLGTYADDLAAEYADSPVFAAQELDGQFVDLSGEKRYPSLLVDDVSAPAPLISPPALPPISGSGALVYSMPPTTRFYATGSPGVDYRIGADCAEGLAGGDDSTGAVVERISGRVVCVLAGEYEPQEEHPAYLAMLSRHYNGAPVLVERNNHGHAVLGGLRRLGVECLTGEDKRPGWPTSSSSKAEIMSAAYKSLEVARAQGDMIFPDRRLADQVKDIDRRTLKGSGKGKIPKVDDEVIAWVLADRARSMAIRKWRMST